MLAIFLPILLAGAFYVILYDEIMVTLDEFMGRESLKPQARVTVSDKSQATKCVYCHDDSWEFKCRCRASYHRECWNETKKCVTLGCTMTSADTRRLVEKTAYDIFCERGREHGHDQENWISAERKVLSGTI